VSRCNGALSHEEMRMFREHHMIALGLLDSASCRCSPARPGGGTGGTMSSERNRDTKPAIGGGVSEEAAFNIRKGAKQ